MARRRDSTSDYSGEVSQVLPDAHDDGLPSGPCRFGKFHEQYVIQAPPDTDTSDGSYFTTNSAFISLTANAAAVFTVGNPFVVVANLGNPANPAAPCIALDYLALTTFALGNTVTEHYFAATLDAIRGTFGLAGGSDLTGNIVSVNGLGAKSVAKVLAGVTTGATLSNASRMVVGQRIIQRGAVLGDVATIKFGGVGKLSHLGASASARTLQQSVPKIIIPPGWWGGLYTWYPGVVSAPSYMTELSWSER